MVAKNYHDFVRAKSQRAADCGFAPIWMPDFLHGFQAHLDEWAIRRGRAAVFADCGLGKTPMFLVWCENMVRHTNRPALAVTTLGDSAQTIQEAEKFGVDAVRSKDGKYKSGARVVVTNYENLHKFDPSDFEAVAYNESSILKNFAGKRKRIATEFMRERPYRSLWTATAAPNDYVELGTSSEAIGELGHMDMLSTFFKNEKGTNQAQRLYAEEAKWRFRGHAEVPFWRWVCSWARAVRKPSDLGFDDGPFKLPKLVTNEHVVEARTERPGVLIDAGARTLDEQREEQRRTIRERCEKVAELVNGTGKPAVCWCHLNDEGDLLEELIPDAIQVSGADSDEAKEEAFAAFASGQARVMVTKDSVAGFGLNWQHCAHQTCFPSYSFERWYQAVRRCWRFGQKRRVVVDEVATGGQAGIVASRKRKADAADKMFARIVELMNDSLTIEKSNPFTRNTEVPSWL